LIDEADRVGRFPRSIRDEPGWIRFEIDFWIAETVNRRLYFHPPDVPVRVWAVSISEGGITWAEAEVRKVTERNVMVRYAGELARLDRRALWRWWAFWRAVRFVSSRTGRIASELDKLWQERYGATGGAPPSMQMPLAQAMAMLGVPADYSREDVMSGYRRAAKKAHPDLGGTAEMFWKLTEARDRLLAALGTSAPPPKPPRYAPKGEKVFYRLSSSSSRARLGTASLRRLR
jgi:predicted DNA-binding transcriptional regulator AlpA/rRNA maturation protein Nop10